MKKSLIVFFMMALGLVVLANSNRGMLQLKGSDTMLNVGQALAENYMKSDKKARLSVTGGGSGTGIAAILNKTVDIAQASRPIKEKELKQGKELGINVKEYVIGFDGITVIVNKANPVSALTSEQLRGIYIGEIKNWKEVGGPDEKIVILSRENSSGTHLFFKEHILRRGNEKGPEEYYKDTLYLPSTHSIVMETVKNKWAIGYIGMGFMDNTVKAVDVDGVKATVENVANKSYRRRYGRIKTYKDRKT